MSYGDRRKRLRCKCGMYFFEDEGCLLCPAPKASYTGVCFELVECISCGSLSTKRRMGGMKACKSCRNGGRRRENREMRMAVQSARASNLRSEGAGSILPGQILGRFAMFGWKCWICGSPAEAVDHIFPLSKGGLNVAANIRPCCRPCNSRKGGRMYSLEQLIQMETHQK